MPHAKSALVVNSVKHCSVIFYHTYVTVRYESLLQYNTMLSIYLHRLQIDSGCGFSCHGLFFFIISIKSWWNGCHVSRFIWNETMPGRIKIKREQPRFNENQRNDRHIYSNQHNKSPLNFIGPRYIFRLACLSRMFFTSLFFSLEIIISSGRLMSRSA